MLGAAAATGCDGEQQTGLLGWEGFPCGGAATAAGGCWCWPPARRAAAVVPCCVLRFSRQHTARRDCTLFNSGDAVALPQQPPCVSRRSARRHARRCDWRFRLHRWLCSCSSAQRGPHSALPVAAHEQYEENRSRPIRARARGRDGRSVSEGKKFALERKEIVISLLYIQRCVRAFRVGSSPSVLAVLFFLYCMNAGTRERLRCLHTPRAIRRLGPDAHQGADS